MPGGAQALGWHRRSRRLGPQGISSTPPIGAIWQVAGRTPETTPVPGRTASGRAEVQPCSRVTVRTAFAVRAQAAGGWLCRPGAACAHGDRFAPAWARNRFSRSWIGRQGARATAHEPRTRTGISAGARLVSTKSRTETCTNPGAVSRATACRERAAQHQDRWNPEEPDGGRSPGNCPQSGTILNGERPRLRGPLSAYGSNTCRDRDSF